MQKPHISFSELKDWVTCPFYHKLVHMVRLKGFLGNEYTAFGTAIHDVCEKTLLQEDMKAEEYIISCEVAQAGRVILVKVSFTFR